MKTIKWLFVLFICLGQACHNKEKKPVIKLGIDVLEERNFDVIQNKRIGVLTSKASVDSKGSRTWEVLKDAPGVVVKSIFAPVHGLDCKFMALETFFNDEVDGIPVYAVYASNSRPKDEWLEGLDAVVVDLQGLGVRYYNYWAFMVFMMGACFEHDIEVIVLDRPNPLGGYYVGGPAMDPQYTSIWGPIAGMPLFHGMTIGEIAQYCKEVHDGIVAHQQIETSVIHSGISISKETLRKGKLTVIPMQGWRRDMAWEDTGLEWIQTSPNIKNLQSAMEYAFIAPSLVLAPSRGFDNCNFICFEPDWDKYLPFHSFYSKYTNPQNIIRHIRNTMGTRGTQGFSLEIGKKHNNINLRVSDIRKTIPALFGLAMFILAQQHTRFYFYGEDDYNFFGAHLGDNELLEKIAKMERINFQYFENKWNDSAVEFIQETKRFYLYD